MADLVVPQPPRGAPAWITRRPLVAYFLFAYAFSWAVELPIALVAQGLARWRIPFALYYLASFGPLLAALLVTAAIAGRPGLRDLLRRLLQWRVEPRYAIFAVLAPAAFFAIAALATRLVAGAWPDLALLGALDYLPYLGLPAAAALWFLTYGLGEEVGWRGFALPHLQSRWDARTAALILGLLWAGWHLPAFFFRDTYQAMGPLGFPIFVISLLCASIILTWLYNGTHGSLLMVILFHALYNWLTVSEAGGPYVAILMGAAAVFWAVRIHQVHGPENLAPVERQRA
jgi:uncharacterized protein